MKPLLIIFFSIFISQSTSAKNQEQFIKKVLTGNLMQKAVEMVETLGLNCVKEYPLFKKELVRALAGLAEVISESTVTLAHKKDFPNICHVMTDKHIEKNESTIASKNNDKKGKCFDKNILGTCLIKGSITKEILAPYYYWPKYFIEVTQRGNDFHPTFADNNRFFDVNRQIAASLPVDKKAAISTVAMLGASQFKIPQLLKKIGIDVGEVNEEELMKALALLPFEKQRKRANQSKTGSSFDVNIWPVALSASMAEHFSVCGPYKKELGQDPGGYSWPIRGVPMTCPVALSSDAMAYWDTGIMDYLDPVALTGMVTASNLFSCAGAQAMDQLGAMNKVERQKMGDKKEISSKIKGLESKFRNGIKNCSWPILGNKEALIKKVVSMTDTAKWKGPYCSLWGSLYPRSSTTTYNNDYSFANSGLKFKLLAHELFGLPRGDEERWSLAYPWEGSDSSIASRKQAKNFLDKLKKVLPNRVFPKRSENLYKAGDPRLIDISYTGKFITDRLNPIKGNRRIYTVWEKISCDVASSRTKIKAAGIVKVEKYKDCKAAIRFKVLEFIQNELLRSICDFLGQEPGKPWL